MSVLAAVMPAPRVSVEIREFPEPDLPPGGALLRTALSEVCGTDVHLWHGRLSGVPYPIIPGHVTTGTLDKIRGSLTDVSGRRLHEGDRVAFFDVHRTCGRCLACTVHRTPTRCPSRRVYGITDPASEGLFGGWSQKVYLEPGVIVARPAGQCVVRGVHRRRLRTADVRCTSSSDRALPLATRWSCKARARWG
jgi:L-iditol 2-dehydrogenase